MNSFCLVALTAFLSTAVGCAAESAPTNDPQGKQGSGVNGDPAPSAPDPKTGGDSTPGDGKPTTDPTPAPACTPLAKPSGSVNPAAVYCTALGYTLASEQCSFPDGASCEEWAFYRGECGQTHSFCNLHGGAVSNKVENMGSFTASYALCTFPDGKQCHEDAFSQTCACE